VVDNKIYVIGGGVSEPSDIVLSSVEEYDPVADTWTSKADMPIARVNMVGSSAVVDGRVYVIGGDNEVTWGSRTVQEYDPATDTWTLKADMPTPRWSLATCAVDGKIYAIGGAPDSYTGLSVVEQYDPATDTWTRKADMPTGVWGLCARVVDGKIYALGGRPGTNAIAAVQEYDPATDIWTQKADMPVATSQMDSVVLGGKIVVIGGWLNSGSYPYTAVQIYDPETDTWTIGADVPFLRAVFSADVVNNRIYAIGGTDRPHPCPATSTVYELTIGGEPDFSADGVVDITDLLGLVESWGQNDPLADIAPAFGDGVVDVLDLEFLMGYWGQEIDDPTLVAHWAFDETEGITAADRTGRNDATVIGVAAWQPDGGQVGGALELDGATFVVAGSVLDPSDGPFSVLAWVNGGAPGQALISQVSGVNWLMADELDGALMTELRAPTRDDKRLVSETVITDGDWHRVAFVWDGANRMLYADGVLVASDTQPKLAGCAGSLIIGRSSAMTPGTSWTGLIDDVRIYNRVVKP
jgi:N-acetylneuraminic acid mutarotase